MSSGEPMTDHTAGQRKPSAPSRGSVANHDAVPAAITVSDEVRTDKAATSHRRDRSGNTPVAEYATPDGSTEHAGSAAAQPSAASAGYALLDTHGKMDGADEMLQTPHRLLTSTPTTNRSEAMAKSSKRLVWDNYATDAWSATRDGKLLCRIRRGPKSGRWMLLRCVVGKAWLGDVSEWHSDYDSLREAKAAARSL